MKKLLILPFLVGAVFSDITATTLTTSTAKEVLHMETAAFKVYGNCGMCRKRIEAALKDETGIEAATWDVKTKIITVIYNPHTTSLETIKETIALAGHDTDETKAADKTYDKLPGCCHYERAN